VTNQFKQNGFLVVRNYLDQIGLDLSLLQEYFYLKFSCFKSSSSRLTPGSFNYYGDTLTETILKLSLNKFENYTGFNLLPSYSYTRLYVKGNKLTKHMDRSAAEISATMCVDISDKEYPPTIYMSETNRDEDAIPLILNPGDLCLYHGSRMWHWRDRIKNDWMVQCFFHFIDADGESVQQIYDGRSGLGLPPICDEQPKLNIESSYYKQYISNAYRSIP
jgi:hypothetical protein